MFDAVRRLFGCKTIRQKEMPKDEDAARQSLRENLKPQSEEPNERPVHYIQPPRRFH